VSGPLRKVFPYAFHFHAKTLGFDADGLERELDYAEIAAIAQESSYRGLLSVEFEGEGDDRRTGILQTVALLERCFSPAEVAAAREPAPRGDAVPPAMPPVGAPPPYIARIRTESRWPGARSAIIPFIERLAAHEETAGVVILGGLADSPHRRFVDSYSDLDLALFLSISEARGYTCSKQFWSDHPELLPLWLPSFQFDVAIDGALTEVNCHQLVLEIEESPAVPWGLEKQEAYLNTGEVRYDPSGRIAHLIEQKSRDAARMDRLITLASQLPWYGWVNPERQIGRGFPETGHLLVNRALEIILEILFLGNGHLAPHLKWRFEMAVDLPWLPGGFRARFSRILGVRDLAARIAMGRALGEEILEHLKAEGLIPEDPFRYASLHLDRDRQLRPRTAADRLFDLSPELRRDPRRGELVTEANLRPLRLSEIRTEDA